MGHEFLYCLIPTKTGNLMTPEDMKTVKNGASPMSPPPGLNWSPGHHRSRTYRGPCLPGCIDIYIYLEDHPSLVSDYSNPPNQKNKSIKTRPFFGRGGATTRSGTGDLLTVLINHLRGPVLGWSSKYGHFFGRSESSRILVFNDFWFLLKRFDPSNLIRYQFNQRGCKACPPKGYAG